jgi:ring-1,2-phenylacetyl-CoA epoxidase subunit PaaE
MHLSPNQTCVAFTADAGILSAVDLVKRLLAEEGAKRVLVFCGMQSEEHAEPLEELLALKDRHLERLSLSFVMNREPDESELLTGSLDAAKVSALASKLFDAQAVREYYVCGSRELADDVKGALGRLGVDPTRIQLREAAPQLRSTAVAAASGNGTAASTDAADLTASSASGAQSLATTPDANSSRAIPSASETRVEFIMDGRRRAFSMHTGTETILDAATRANIDLPFSCKAGVCSTCRTKLVRGKVEMAQNYALEDWELEQGFILACQSHAQTPEIEITYDEK